MAKNKDELIANRNLRMSETTGKERNIYLVTKGEVYVIADYFEKGKYIPQSVASRMIELGTLVKR
jgi:hypothetical protein